MNLIELCEKIYEYDNFIIIPHVNPDGDSVGSSLSLCTLLRKIGKTAYIADIKNNMPKNMEFLSVDGFVAPKDFCHYNPKAISMFFCPSPKTLKINHYLCIYVNKY